jgi:hypothetical protein
MDDEALLNKELYWRSSPGNRTRPAGSNAITAIGLVITLVLWGITAVVIERIPKEPSPSGMIEPRSLIVLVVFGVEMFVAAMIAGRVWVAIGPGARGILRPLGALGPWPMIGIMFFASVWVIALVVAPFMPDLTPPSSGRNWRVVAPDRAGVPYEEAARLCDQPGERVPSREDVARFDPPFAAALRVWLEKPAGADLPFGREANGEFALFSGASHRAHAVCFRP